MDVGSVPWDCCTGEFQHYGETAKTEDERKLARYWVMGQAGSLKISEESWGGVG